MTEVPKPSSRDLKRLGMSLAVLAAQRLADPDVRAQLAAHGRTLAASAREWRAERSSVRSAGAGAAVEAIPTGPDGPSSTDADDLRLPPPGLADRVGRRRLQRRVDRLRVSVLALGEGRPELAARLDPVLAALEEVTSALEVAAGLPLARRLRAHQRVDGVLDALETALFEAALPQLPGPPG
ncbi:MAG: hypothetical protein KDB04_18305 [Acidimicrobiales bacterium]|nr:hypothetical protein [Acidimicrobiales bacterium]